MVLMYMINQILKRKIVNLKEDTKVKDKPDAKKKDAKKKMLRKNILKRKINQMLRKKIVNQILK